MATPMLFQNVVFYAADGQESAASTLKMYGGHQIVDRPAVDDAAGATHVVCDKDEYYKYESLQDRLHVVTGLWVKRSVQHHMMLNATFYSADPEKIFSGYNFYCLELPVGDTEAIYGGVNALGGDYSMVMNRRVTHIIALHTEHDLAQNVLKRGRYRLILPHWFDACIRLRRLVDEEPYMFPHPAILARDGTMTRQDNNGQKYESQPVVWDAHKAPSTYTQFFPKLLNKTFLSADVELSSSFLINLKDIITNVGGSLVNRVEEADIYIGKYRAGKDYAIARSRDIIIGSLTWIFHMLSHNSWINSRSHLLHYPAPVSRIEGMSGLEISLSNYKGESRIYLGKLIEACGAKYSRNLHPLCTHLITSKLDGEKYAHAKLWGNIHIVNHIWIEECFNNWRHESVATPRYIDFPDGVELGRLVGQTTIDEDGLAKSQLKVEGEILVHDPDLPTIPISSQAPAIHSQNERPVDTQDIEAHSTVLTNLVNDSKANAILSHEVIEAPPSTTRRMAAARAKSRLHDHIMPDVMRFEKAMRRKRKSIPLLPSEQLHSSASGKSSVQYHDMSPALPTDPPSEANQSEVSDNPLKVMLTGVDVSESKFPALEALGFTFVEDPSTCTHVVASGLSRTAKFLAAIPYTPKFVHKDWLYACIDQNRLLDTKKFPINDTEKETKYNVVFVDALERARHNKRQLFADMNFHITPKVANMHALGQIVTANGGTIVPLSPSKRVKSLMDNGDSISVMISCEDDRHSWGRYQRTGSHKVPILTKDWILVSVLRQQLLNNEEFRLV